MLGEVVYVEYPHLVEALVTGVHTETHDYLLEETCVVKKLAVSSKKDCFKHLKSRECIALVSILLVQLFDSIKNRISPT